MIKLFNAKGEPFAGAPLFISSRVCKNLGYENTLDFELPFASVLLDVCRAGNKVGLDDDEFYIKEVSLNDAGSPLISVHCEHISYKLIDVKLDKRVVADNVSVASLLGFLLDMCEGFRVDILQYYNDIAIERVNFSPRNVREALIKIVESVGGRLFFKGRKVFIDNGLADPKIQPLVISDGANLCNISCTYDTTSRISDGSLRVVSAESIYPGDVVSVKNSRLGVNERMQVSEVSYDPCFYNYTDLKFKRFEPKNDINSLVDRSSLKPLPPFRLLISEVDFSVFRDPAFWSAVGEDVKSGVRLELMVTHSKPLSNTGIVEQLIPENANVIKDSLYYSCNTTDFDFSRVAKAQKSLCRQPLMVNEYFPISNTIGANATVIWGLALTEDRTYSIKVGGLEVFKGAVIPVVSGMNVSFKFLGNPTFLEIFTEGDKSDWQFLKKHESIGSADLKYEVWQQTGEVSSSASELNVVGIKNSSGVFSLGDFDSFKKTVYLGKIVLAENQRLSVQSPSLIECLSVRSEALKLYFSPNKEWIKRKRVKEKIDFKVLITITATKEYLDTHKDEIGISGNRLPERQLRFYNGDTEIESVPVGLSYENIGSPLQVSVKLSKYEIDDSGNLKEIVYAFELDSLPLLDMSYYRNQVKIRAPQSGSGGGGMNDTWHKHFHVVYNEAKAVELAKTVPAGDIIAVISQE